MSEAFERKEIRMTKEEAANIISGYEVYGCGYCLQGGDEVEEALRLAVDALKQEPKWIPITERLPDYYERVLVFTRFDGVHVGFRGMIGDKDYYFLGGIDKRVGLGTIRAWMSIPQPYEEKEE